MTENQDERNDSEGQWAGSLSAYDPKLDLQQQLKIKLNELVFTYSPGTMTIDDADCLAAHVMKEILDGKVWEERPE